MSEQRDYLPLEDSSLFWLFKATQATSDLHKWYLQTYSLTRPQIWALISIHNGATRPKELADTLGIDRSGVTRLTDQLTSKGYIRRCRQVGDRRALHLEPTEKALKSLPQLQSAAHNAERLLLCGLRPGQISALREATRRIVENARDQDLSGAFALLPEESISDDIL
ncbi:MarR family transcriptional regulator [bacterium]|nr:MarR family transcriptional regulator [bacterium]